MSDKKGIRANFDIVVDIAIVAILFFVPVIYRKGDHIAEFLWIKGYVLNITAYIALALFWVGIILKGKLRIPLPYLWLPVLCIGGATLLSLTQAINPYKATEMIVEMHGALLTYFLLSQGLKREGTRRIALLAITAAAVYVTVYGLMQYYGVYHLPRDQYGEADPSTTLGLSNFVCEYLMTAMPLIAVLLVRTEFLSARIPIAISLMITFYYFVIAEVRGSYVGLVGSVGVAVFLFIHWTLSRRMEKFSWRAVAGLALFPVGLVSALLFFINFVRGISVYWASALAVSLICVAGIYLLIAMPPVNFKVSGLVLAALLALLIGGGGVFSQSPAGVSVAKKMLRVTKFREANIVFRFHSWYTGLQIIKDKPILGVGLANLEVAYPHYYTDTLEKMIYEKNTRVVRAHNDYLHTFIEQGAVGFAALVFLIVWIFRLIVKNYRRVGEDPAEFFTLAFLAAGIVGLMVNTTLSFATRIPVSALYFWVALGFLENQRRRLYPEECDEETGTKVLRFDFSGESGYDTAKMAPIVLGLVVTLGIGASAIVFSHHATEAEVLYKEAKYLNKKRQYTEGKSKLNRAIEHNPNGEAYHFDRSIANLKLGFHQQAMQDMHRVTELVPYFGLGLERYGSMLMAAGQFSEGIKYLERAKDILFSRRGPIYTNLCQGWFNEGEIEKAESYCHEALKARKRNDDASYTLGRIYAGKGDFNSAARHYENALTANPNFLEAMVNLGVIYNNQGRLDRAEELLLKAGQIQPNFSAITFNLASIYCRKGDMEQARAKLIAAFAQDRAMRSAVMTDECLKPLYEAGLQ